MTNTITLYKSVSPAQLSHLIKVDWRYFIPESPEQKLFAPKLHRSFAEMLARQIEAANHCAGYVVSFDILEQVISRYDITSVAYEEYEEYCIPIEDLRFINMGIEGKIKLVSQFSSSEPTDSQMQYNTG